MDWGRDYAASAMFAEVGAGYETTEGLDISLSHSPRIAVWNGAVEVLEFL